MLKRLQIANFKSIGNEGVVLRLKPLTVLVGPNGSGKSSILEALALLSQSVNQRGLLTRGPLVDFGEKIDPVIHQSQLARRLSLGVGIELTDGPREAGEYLYEYSTKPATDEYEQKITYMEQGHGRPLVRAGNPLSTGERDPHVYLVQYFEGRDRGTSRQGGGPPSIPLDWRIFLPGQQIGSLPVGEARLDDRQAWVRATVENLSSKLLDKVRFLTALRGDVSTLAALDESGVSWVGRQGENLLITLALVSGPTGDPASAEKIKRWAREFGLAELNPGYMGGRSLGARYKDSELGSSLDLKLASQGSRQVLCIIAQVFSGTEEDVILIEEPEISLHPEAQVKIVEMFAEAIGTGKQIIMTSHSHYLLLALTDAIRRKILKATDVSVWEVAKDEDHGTRAAELPLTDEGIIKGWISSFAKVDSGLLQGRAGPSGTGSPSPRRKARA